jgi:hypothetical protein
MTTRPRILTWHPRRAVFLVLGATAFAVTEFGRLVLRPHVREHGIDDLGLTDSIGNSGGILVQIFLAFAIMNPDRKRSYLFATFFAAGYIVYEFLQPHLPRGVFDWNDVWGTLIGYAVALPILALVWRLAGDADDR